MLLFALCLKPLLCIFEDKLTGVQIGRRSNKTAVVAYAGNVTICNITRWNKNNTRCNTLLRNCAWSATKCPEIQGHGDRTVGDFNWHNGHSVPYGNDPMCPDKQTTWSHNQQTTDGQQRQAEYAHKSVARIAGICSQIKESCMCKTSY